MLDDLLAQIEPFYACLPEIGFDAKRTRALEKALRMRASDLNPSTRPKGR